jgi:hypothetical protein
MPPKTTKPTAEPKEPQREFSPLFPHDPEEGKDAIYADEIKSVRISRQMSGFRGLGGSKYKRAKISKDEFFREDEHGNVEEFEFDPFTTTEDDIEDWFGGGEFYLQPISHDNTFLRNARTIYINAPIKTDDDDSDEEEMPPPEPPAPKQNTSEVMVIQLMQEMLRNERELNRQKDAAINDRIATKAEGDTQLMTQFAAIQSLSGQKNDGTLEALRHQLNEQTSQYREDLRRRDREVEELRAANRLEVERRDRQFEEYRKHSMDELAEIRKRMNDDSYELKKRLNQELEDAREKYKRDLQYESERLARKAADLQKELDDKAKRVHELEKETIELERDLASVPKSEPAPAAAEAAPWWAGMASGALREIGKIAGARAPAPPPPQPAMVYQQMPQQMAPPPQQYQPPAQRPAVRMAPPPPPEPPPAPAAPEPAAMEFTNPTLYGGPATAVAEVAA